MSEGYIKIRDLLDFCDNQKYHSATPNDIMRMNHSYFTENYPCWISVKDRLPEEGEEVLVWNDEGFCYVDEIKNGMWKIPGVYSGNTHWMPLPEPPREE